jgi:hypothetical protein
MIGPAIEEHEPFNFPKRFFILFRIDPFAVESKIKPEIPNDAE